MRRNLSKCISLTNKKGIPPIIAKSMIRHLSLLSSSSNNKMMQKRKQLNVDQHFTSNHHFSNSKKKNSVYYKTTIHGNHTIIGSSSVSSRSFSTAFLKMQNNDAAGSKTNPDGFTNMMNTLFVKVGEPVVNESIKNHSSMHYYDLDKDEFCNPLTDPFNKTLTENGALTFQSSGSGLVDFFYFTVEGISQNRIHKLLDASWSADPLRTLKVIFFIRDIRRGKGENEIFYETQRWLALNHPQTFLENLKHVPKTGYWKDLQNILLYIKYGGHEVDERPNTRWSRKQSKILKRLPSSKTLQEREVFHLRRSCKTYNAEGTRRVLDTGIFSQKMEEIDKRFNEDGEANLVWKSEITQHDKLVLNPDQNKKLKLVYEKAKGVVVDLYVGQLRKDQELFSNGQPISLCAKWAPTVNKSVDRDIGIGRMIARNLFSYEQPGGIYLTKRKEGKGNSDFTDQQVYRYLANIKYQKLLRDLRKATITIETLMSSKQWASIPYEKVPSICMDRNKKLFGKRDNTRFNEHLDKAKKGETKINGKAVFPHELVEQFIPTGFFGHNTLSKEEKEVIELQWKDIVKNLKKQSNYGLFQCIPVCDVSGSMYGTPLHVATALSLIMSEVNDGIFKDRIITFSETPTFVNLGNVESLEKRLGILCKSEWMMNTNYLAVFKLILKHAVSNKLPKDQMIKKIVVFSDMQFDQSQSRLDRLTSHQQLAELFHREGYEAPSIVYWNLNGGYENIPVTVNTDGVTCISGFNTTLLRMLNEGEITGDMIPFIDSALGKDYDFLTLHD